MVKRHRTSDLEPTSFGGRYTLVRRLAVGGMAEIYLARQAAMAGFEKEVVIKRLRHELADDPRIVEMFLDEARIGALLNHPNIVHVYDVDEHDGIPYIAMEYIVGEELNELCRRGIAHDRFLPLEHAVELMRQAAAGMGYFHSKRGAEGSALANAPLDIVHFDISPSNLLVTQDGFLKVIDFGIARARGQRQRGETLPGKLSYMSPEQAGRGASGEAPAKHDPVDHRSDIFSLGIVLYEITVGRRLFRGNAQEVVAKLVEAHVEPPTFVRRTFPPALEAIVMRALEKHPDDRYQSAYDLADDLETFLRDERLHSGPVRIARYLDMLAAASGGKRRPELVSEAEARGELGGADGNDLDFDQQAFDSFAPVEGAPGPAQARDWEDPDQPEADVATALGLGLEELRMMRTPVPVRPAGMAPVSAANAPLPDQQPPVRDPALHRAATAPPVRKRPITVEEEDALEDAEQPRASTDPGDGQDAGDESGPVDFADPYAAPASAPWPTAAQPGAWQEGQGYVAQPPPPFPTYQLPPPQQLAPPAGAAPGKPVSSLPWMLVGFLGVAVLSLVAYIFLK